MMEFELKSSDITHVLPNHFANLKECSSENLIAVAFDEKERMVVIHSLGYKR